MFGVPMWAIGAGIAVALIVGAYWQGTMAGRAGCELRVERAVANEQARQRDVMDRALEADAKAATAIAKDKEAGAAAVRKIITDAASGGACVDTITDGLKRDLETIRIPR